MQGVRGFVGALVAALVLLTGGEAATAATLKGSYQLQGNRTSTVVGAPDLTDLGTGNRFVTETVDGTARQVLAFRQGDGLSLDTAGLVDPGDHSVVMLFRLAKVSGYRRLLDFSNGASDNGLYSLNGKAALYVHGNVAESKGQVFGDSYVHVAMTSAGGPDKSHDVAVYVNGLPVAGARTSEGFGLESGELRFFRDNHAGGASGEESAGALACALVYDGVLTPAEVAQVADSPALCPAPKSELPAKALATGKPRAMVGGRAIVVDTGLTVGCPVGTATCEITGAVDVASPRRGAEVDARRRLGTSRFSLPGGASRRVVVRLSRRGDRALRRAGRLRIRASAKIVVSEGGSASVHQVGLIEGPRALGFKTGSYTGTTGQGLPIFMGVGRTGVDSVYFRWRAKCADGEVHTSAIVLIRARVRRGRFSFDRRLRTGGRVHLSGRLRGVRASGVLSRTGPSAFGTKCKVKKTRWRARVSGTEIEASA